MMRRKVVLATLLLALSGTMLPGRALVVALPTGHAEAIGAIPATSAGWSLLNSGSGAWLKGISCSSDPNCYAVGDNGAILSSFTSGSSWTARSSGTAATHYSISCATWSTCIAVGLNGAIQRTSDGGNTWSAQSSGTTSTLHTVSCPSSSNCIVFGNNGAILTTANAGATWVAQHSGTSDYFYGGACPSLYTCIAVGGDGIILVTTNGGSAWTSQASGVTVALRAAACPTVTTCFVVGDGGTIVATTNRGASWTTESSGTSTALLGVSCVNTSTCYAVGPNGTIVATTNGGANWSPQASGTQVTLYAASCTSDGACYAAGDEGTILRSSPSGPPPPSPTPTVSGQPPTPTPTTTRSGAPAVFVILMENTNWSSIAGNASAPYINNTLLPIAAHANQYYNPPGNHPSLPNYLWLEAGTNFGIHADGDPSLYHQSTTSHLVTVLNNAGISWKAYEEGISGSTCPLSSQGLYAAKHNPFVYFDDVTGARNPNSSYCIAHERPFGELAGNLQNNTVARYNFITPNECDDMHNSSGCATSNSIRNGDTWLAQEVPMILASQAYRNGGVLFITWDEAASGDGPIGLIALSPDARAGYANSIYYTHSSLLRTIEEILGVGPLLGDAAHATDLSNLFTTLP